MADYAGVAAFEWPAAFAPSRQMFERHNRLYTPRRFEAATPV